MGHNNLRGSKRKFRNLERLLKDSQLTQRSYHLYTTIQLPAARNWVESLSNKGKNQIVQLLLQRGSDLFDENIESGIVTVVMLHLEKFWHSQIIAFSDERSMHEFFECNEPYQTWEQIDSSSLIGIFNLYRAPHLKAVSFKETIDYEEYKEINTIIFLILQRH